MALRPQTRGNGSVAPGRAPLPARYQDVWDAPFRKAIEAVLRPGMSILDLGSGRNPTIPPDERPRDVKYVGLDLSADELAAAAPTAYNEHVVANIGSLQDQLVGRFDLIVSWQVLEHVHDLGAAMICIRAYLKPGGSFVAMFSGSWSAFAIINRVLPFHIGAPIVSRVMGRSSSNPVFLAYYDRCYASALTDLLTDWSSAELSPFFRGAEYFRFSTLLSRMYLLFEDRVAAARRDNLATHYLVVATR